MPYITAPVPQALDLTDPGVVDVYSSPTVFINYQQAALWNAPQLGTSVLTQLAIPVPPPLANYAPNPEQISFYKATTAAAEASPIQIEIGAGGGGAPGSIVNQAQGDPPGSNTSDPNDLAGNPDVASGVPIAGGDSVFGRLENLLNQCIQEGAAGKWNAQGGAPVNPNIMNCFAHTGGIAAAARIGPGDSVAWCAAFAGTTLQGAGAKALISFQADAYRTQWVSKTGATALSLTDPTTWRRNDLVVMLTPTATGTQHHVAFIRGVDPNTQRVRLAGGNQGHTVNEGNWQSGSLRNVGFVGRQWDIPPEFDKPIIGHLTTGGVVVTR